MAEDFETSKKAYQFLAGHVDNWKADQEKANRGRDHTVNKMAAEIEDMQEAIEKLNVPDLWEANQHVRDLIDKIAAYLKKKFPEDFKGGES